MMTRFPKLSETFILREMNELERLGYDIALYPLIFQKESVIHEEAESWIPRIRHFPFVSPDVLKTNWDCLIRDPFAYASLWALVVRENRASLKILSRAVVLFPKVMLMAREMQKQGIEHIHAHFATYPALAAWLIHQLTGIGFSVTVHANDILCIRKCWTPNCVTRCSSLPFQSITVSFSLMPRVPGCGIKPMSFIAVSGQRTTGRDTT